MQDRLELEFEGRKYVWTGQTWIDRSGVRPPVTVTHKLNAIRDAKDRVHEKESLDWRDLTRRAMTERDNGRLLRAQELAELACQRAPMQTYPASVLSSILRQRGEPERALAVTQSLEVQSDPPLLCSRAAAMFDLGRWADGKRLLDRAYAIARSAGKNTEEISACYSRYYKESGL